MHGVSFIWQPGRSDYKQHVREINPEISSDIVEVEALSRIFWCGSPESHNYAFWWHIAVPDQRIEPTL